METKTQTTTKTRTGEFFLNGRNVTLNYENEIPVSVTEKNKETYICKNKIETLAWIDNVEFKVLGYSYEERKNSKIKKIVEEQTQYVLEGRSLIERIMPAYFRAGIIHTSKSGNISRLTTRAFFNKNDSPENLPFGKDVLGSVEIQKCTMHNGEERIIINYYLGRIYDHKKDGQFKWKEIKFLSELPEKYDFSFNLFPGQKDTTYIVVK